MFNSTEYIKTPTDVLKLRCFGQEPSIYETLKDNNIREITHIFEDNATVNGLPITHSRYIVRAKV
ncbi:hypothetical protein GCM10008025_32250 [Ornithinibacillus halotolerans]|uniref:Uncharacterized protein n=1 Tax=Ornithinibacillus halotolerans TaxID=1274357 RepID=A0A916S7E2_9BACI|nr:hypothetical protein GCM10008025_32250 [Ornithinibacillus halotolerans]